MKLDSSGKKRLHILKNKQTNELAGEEAIKMGNPAQQLQFRNIVSQHCTPIAILLANVI